MTVPGNEHESLAFSGFDPPAWPSMNGRFAPRVEKKILAGKITPYRVAVRVEPVEDLRAFGDFLAKVTGHALGREPDADDNAMYLVFFIAKRTPDAALRATQYKVDKWLRRARGAGHQIARITWDVGPLPYDIRDGA